MELRNFSIFSGFSDHEVGAVAALMVEKRLSEGAAVYLEHMPGESLYLIKSGTIRISKMLGEGEEKTLVVLGPGEFFGEMALLDGSARAATARVLEVADLQILRKADFENFATTYPAIALKLIRNVVKCFCRKLHDSNQEIKDLILASLK